MRISVLVLVGIFIAMPAMAHTAHTVDFNKGDTDSVTSRAPENMPASGSDMAEMHVSNVPSSEIDCAHPFDASIARMDKVMMSQKPTGNVDTDFATMMIPHHQGAIDMAQAELKCGHDPRLLDLSRNIIQTQQSEIQLLQGTLAKPAAAH